jgi:hypothetical protein
LDGVAAKTTAEAKIRTLAVSTRIFINCKSVNKKNLEGKPVEK